MNASRCRLVAALLSIAVLLPGCGLSLSGPSAAFPASKEQVKSEYARMKSEPTPLARPLLILDGWTATGGGGVIKGEMEKLTGAKDQIVLVTYFPGGGPETQARHGIDAVQKKWPSDDPDWTVEVDVIGYSNGGIYARVAAAPPMDGEPRRRLKINRLYTIATPHRGVRPGLGRLGIDASARAVSPGSKTLVYLDEQLATADYELTCYAEVNDELVGAQNSAPPDREVIWTESNHLMSHLSVASNQRILTDIALQLRGEPKLSGEPSAPPKQ